MLCGNLICRVIGRGHGAFTVVLELLGARGRGESLMRAVAMLVVGLALSSCAGSKVQEDPPAEWRSNTRVYRASETPRGARVLGQITARSCKSKPWDPDPTDEDATRQLQVDALGMGGDAVGNVTCGVGSALATNCLSSIVCRGTAIRVTER